MSCCPCSMRPVPFRGCSAACRLASTRSSSTTARPAVRLAPRDGDARVARGLAHRRGTSGVSPPHRRALEGDGNGARHRPNGSRHAGGPALVHVMVMAKAPVAGRVKTRLTPEYTLEEAATLAEAALADPPAAALACSADRVIVALDGEPGPWPPPG